MRLASGRPANLLPPPPHAGEHTSARAAAAQPAAHPGDGGRPLPPHRAYPRTDARAAQVKLGRTLGEGTFGAVVEGKWRGARVAVKRLKTAALANAATLADFRAEVGSRRLVERG